MIKATINITIVLAVIFGAVFYSYSFLGAEDDINIGQSAGLPYELVSNVNGYVTKSDPTNTPPQFLVAGSQNVIINDLERVETRAGFALFGNASTTAQPVKSDFTWSNSSGVDILLREINGTLEFFQQSTSSSETLLQGLSTTSPVRFATVWSSTELIDLLLFVNASSIIYEWSGGQATLSATTSTTIVLDGLASTTGRFLTNGTREVRLKNDDGSWTVFVYTGQSGSTLSGVTPDPNTGSRATGALVVQEVRLNSDLPFTGYSIDVIKTLQNQVFLGSEASQRVFISSNTSFIDFSFSSPRVAGEGAVLTLDAGTIGFESPDDEKMIIFSGKNKVYQMTFEISPGSTADREVPRVRPLLTADGQGAISQELIGKIKQAVVWVSNNKELVELGQIENITQPQSRPISDPIKPDFIAADFTNGEIEFFRNNIFITAPPDGTTFIYDLANRFWQPPQTIGVRRLSVFNNLLYGHSNSVPETYELFTGLSDNGNDIAFKAHYSYRNSGERARLKQFNRYFTELFIAGNTTVTASILYEWKGAKTTLSYDLDGSDETFLFTPVEDNSLGVNPLGTNPLGGQLVAGEETPKYRRFKPLVPTDYFEYQIRFSSDQADAVWKIISTGANVQLSNNLPTKISK